MGCNVLFRVESGNSVSGLAENNLHFVFKLPKFQQNAGLHSNIFSNTVTSHQVFLITCFLVGECTYYKFYNTQDHWGMNFIRRRSIIHWMQGPRVAQ